MTTLNFDLFWRDHGVRAGLTGIGNQTQKTGTQAQKMEKAFTIAGTAAGLALAEFAKKSVQAASDLQQSTGGAQAVFGKFSNQVITQSKAAATAYGLSANQYLEMSNELGALLKNQGVSADKLAGQTNTLIKLGSDMAATFGGPTSDAVEALTAAFKGEFDPIEKYGVTLNATTIQTQLAAKGQGHLAGAALATAKQQQILQDITKQTAVAQGQFAAQTNTTAEKAQIAKAQFTNLSAELGTKLLPVVNEGLGVLSSLANFLDKNGRIVGPVALGFAGLATSVVAVNKTAAGVKATKEAWGSLTGVFSRAGKAAEGAAEGAEGAGSALGSMTALINPWSLAIGAGVAVLAVWMKRQQESKQRVQELKDALDQQTGSLTANARQVIYKQLADSGAIAAAKALGVSLRDVTDAASGNEEAMQRVNEQITASQPAIQKATSAQDRYNTAGIQWTANSKKLRNVLGDQNSALVKARGDIADATAAGVQNTQATDNSTTAVKKNTAAVKDNSQALETSANKVLSLRSAENDYWQSVDDATKALKTNGHTLDEHTQKGRDNRAALDKIVSSTYALRDAAKSDGKSIKDQTSIMEAGRQKIIQMAEKFGMGKKAAQQYANEVLRIPKRVSSTISLSLHNSIPKTIYGVRVGGGQGSTRGGITFNAAGGPINGPGTATSDSIPAMLSDGEHVWSAAEVSAAGGHTAMSAMRKAVLRRSLGGPIGTNMRAGEGRLTAGTSSRLGDRVNQAAGYALMGLLGGMGGGSGGNAANRALGQAMAGAYGWGSGAQWAALNAVVTRESGWNNLAQNPTSTAYGIFQFLNGTWGSVGARKTSNAGLQIAAGLRYIRSRYDSPLGALAHEHSYGWYGSGGLASRPGLIGVGENGPERVLSAAQTRAFENLVPLLDRVTKISVHQDGNQAINYDKLAAATVKAFAAAGVAVKIDGKAIGRVIGQRADLLARAR